MTEFETLHQGGIAMPSGRIVIPVPEIAEALTDDVPAQCPSGHEPGFALIVNPDATWFVDSVHPTDCEAIRDLDAAVSNLDTHVKALLDKEAGQ